MMKEIIKMIRIFLIVFLFIFTSCSSEDGVDGVVGAQGIQGEQGIPGQDGAGGQDGVNGVDGVNGQDGVQGLQGEQGIPGQDGADGQDGVNGVDGANGQDGIQGLQGEQGIPGQDGADGVNGQNGEDGEIGTANVIYSEFFEPVWNVFDEPRFKRLTISNTNFSLVRDDGVVLFYLTFGNGSTILLPYHQFTNAGVLNYSADSIILGASNNVQVTVRSFGVDLTSGQYDGAAGFRLRYVIIPGGTLANSRNSKASVDFNNYEAVKKYYGIKN